MFQKDVATYDSTTLSSTTKSKNKTLSLNNNDNKEEKDEYNKEDFNNSEEKMGTYMKTLRDQSKKQGWIKPYQKIFQQRWLSLKMLWRKLSNKL